MIKQLTQEQRIDARHKAYDAIRALAGDKPSREHYKSSSYGKYPGWIVGAVVALAGVVLAMSFILSAMRLYQIGSETFAASIPHSTSSMVAGIAIVLLSEAASVLFTLALSVIGQTRFQQGILLASIIGTALLALSGNYYVALHNHAITLFSVLEAMLPPLLTLSTAYVLKELLLHAIEQRHADNVAYSQALDAWKAATAQPELHEEFQQVYANALRDAIWKANSRSSTARDKLQALDRRGWSILVKREMQENEWYSEEVSESSQSDEDTAEVETVYQEQNADTENLAGAGRNAA